MDQPIFDEPKRLDINPDDVRGVILKGSSDVYVLEGVELRAPILTSHDKKWQEPLGSGTANHALAGYYRDAESGELYRIVIAAEEIAAVLVRQPGDSV